MKILNYILPTTILTSFAAVIAISACSSSGPPEPVVIGPSNAHNFENVEHHDSTTSTARIGPSVVIPERKPAKTPKTLLREVKVYKDLIPKGTHARKYKRRMDPRYITIHSTQNYSSGADAWRHSLALKNGKLRATKRKGGNRIGYLAWHYTIDQNVVVQHIPDNEQGEHADFDGPGNNYSLGLEMCENSGNSRSATIERTAKLAAYLMHEHNIPLSNIKGHYHWPRKGLSKPHKNCPHFLLDNGKPGAKWQWFLAKVKGHYDSITVPVSTPQYAAETPPTQPAYPSPSNPTNNSNGGIYSSPADRLRYGL